MEECMMRTPMYDTFPLGKSPKCLASMDCGKTQLNNNVVVVGGSGAGKTCSVLYPMLLHLQYGNAVGIFTKHSQEQKLLANRLKRCGYKIYTIDFSNPETSPFGYDPLSYCRNDDDVNDLVKNMADYDGGHGHSDRYWSDMAKGVISSVFRYVQRGDYIEGKNLYQALKLLDSLPLTTWDEDDSDCSHEGEFLYHEWPNMFACDPQAEAFWTANIFKNADNTKACIISSAQALIENLFTTSVRRMIAGKKFNFHKLLQPKTILFVYTSPVNNSMEQFASLFYRQLFQQLFNLAEEQRNKKLPYPVYVLCDDFATGARIEDFPKLISIFREKGIAVTLLIQSESQLSSLYGEADATTIINNCDRYIYLGGMDLATCQNISVRINKPCNEILSMSLGKEYFFCRGQKPIQTERYNLFSDPLYLELTQNKVKQGAYSQTMDPSAWVIQERGIVQTHLNF